MNQLLQWNNQLMNAPAGVIVALFAIGLGYILKTAAFFPNNRIPLVVVMFTAVAFPVVQYCADATAGIAHAGLRVPLNILIGFVIGFSAWMFHYQILKRFVDPLIFKSTTPNPPPNP